LIRALDPRSFCSDRLPVEHFDERFSEENLAFWVPVLVELGRVEPGCRVLDIGCGTGGFSRGIAEAAPAEVTGLDSSERFVTFAEAQPAPARGSVRWLVGDAEALPFDGGSFDRVLLSFVLHQLAEPEAAVAEAFRVLVGGGIVLVRTVAPEEAGKRVPERYLASMAEADAARLPPIAAIQRWLVETGFVVPNARVVLRNKKLNLADEERQLGVEVRSRYPFISAAELRDGVRRMRADAERQRGEWIDARPTTFLRAEKP
jgi:ubiquinone/menaquinone biosynthesis C-methylase UbiE